MMLNNEQKAEFQKSKISEINAMTKEFSSKKPVSEIFDWTQKIQQLAIQIFESTKGSIPDNWISETKEPTLKNDTTNKPK